MLDAAAAVSVKFKRRKLSAIRSFPKGCRALVANRVVDVNDDEKVVEEVERRKELKENGSTGVPEFANGDVDRLGSVDADGDEKAVELKENGSTDAPEFVTCDGERFCSKKYRAPKRRKVSTVRHFPSGCVRNSLTVAVGVGSSKEAMNVREVEGGDMENRTVADGIVSEEGVRMEPINEEAVRESCGESKSNGEASNESPKPNDLDGEAMVESPERKNLDGKDMIELLKPMHLDGEGNLMSPKLKNSFVDVMVNSPTLINLDGGKAMVKSPTHKDLNEESSVKSPKIKNSEGEAAIKSLRSKDSDAEIMAVTNLQIIEEVDTKTSDSNRIKEKVGTISDKARVKSPLSRSTSEDNIEEHNEKKILMRSTCEKKIKGIGVKQVSKNHQAKQELGDDSLSSGPKVADMGVKSLRGKHAVKLLIKGAKDGISLKRKLAEEVVEESVEAYGDRLVVQALMSAENCPWRKGKKTAGSGSRSATPKFKAKDKQKVPSRSLALRGFSTSQHNIVDLEDEEDTLSQEDGNEKTLVVFKQSRELSITLPPCVPPNPNHNGANSEGASARALVKRSLRLFQWITRKFLQEEEARSRDNSRSQRVDLKAASILKESNNWVNYGGPILGDVPGVEVGDEFHFRVELSIIGIHRPFQGGIDYMKRDDGVILATSIVASGGYPDDIDSSDVLIYSGSGGTVVRKDQQAGDQKLERGNLALKNSIYAKTPVRVVYGFKEQLKGSDSHGAKMVSTYTYDGLYVVEKYWPEKGPNGFSVFKFQLRRMPGQPEIALKEVKKTKKSKIREGLITKDISDGKETIPICVINTFDSEHPWPFKYTTEVIYPSTYVKKSPRGCDCTDGCHDFGNCACVTKNGGEIPYNYNGAIVQAKTLVYECGPSCKCPPSCHNRVSQHGIRIPLEIFKTEKMGWGVRSLYSIPSGSFICEYVGEMLEDTEAEQRSNDEYLFDIGSNYDDHALWEGLPNPIPGLESNAMSETVGCDGFTIDAVEYGNVGRFINHSCSPNLYAQNVLYDHDEKRIPHIMFFAADNIPPLQELTYHYNYSMDQVRDAQGNVKRKDCFCGSPECTGRLY